VKKPVRITENLNPGEIGSAGLQKMSTVSGVRQPNLASNVVGEVSESDVNKIYLEFTDAVPGNDQGGQQMVHENTISS
jgi:hypothetical protein